MAINRVSQSSIQQAFPKFNTAWDGVSAVGGMDTLGVVSLGTATSNITFNSIPATYTHLQIRGLVRLSGSNATRSFYMQVGNGTVATTGYSDHTLQGDGSSATASATANGTEISVGRIATNGHTSGVFGVFVLDILDYANTSKYKTIRNLDGYDNNGSGAVSFVSGNWRSTSAIDTIKFFGSGENTEQYSQFALYGIK